MNIIIGPQETLFIVMGIVALIWAVLLYPTLSAKQKKRK